MLNRPHPPQRRQYGMTLIEVLVTIVILAFGLLGLAGLQSKYNIGMIEAYQRAQALVLLDSLAERIKSNQSNAASYVVASTLGTGDSYSEDCSGEAPGAARDLCEWSNALKGTNEETDGGGKVGAMIGARGCVTQVQAPNPTSGVCTPGIYQITVAWQGMHKTKAPTVACASGSYGDDTNRRAISTRVTVGLPTCN